MSILDHAMRARTLARYRLIFRFSLVTFGIGLAVTTIGVVIVFVSASATVAGAGLLLAAISGLNGYKVVSSTVRLIDLDTDATRRPVRRSY